MLSNREPLNTRAIHRRVCERIAKDRTERQLDVPCVDFSLFFRPGLARLRHARELCQEPLSVPDAAVVTHLVKQYPTELLCIAFKVPRKSDYARFNVQLSVQSVHAIGRREDDPISR